MEVSMPKTHRTPPNKRDKTGRLVVWFPIFEQYTLAALEQKLDYSRNWLLQIRSGYAQASPKFRRRAVKVLKKTERQLFGTTHK